MTNPPSSSRKPRRSPYQNLIWCIFNLKNREKPAKPENTAWLIARDRRGRFKFSVVALEAAKEVETRGTE